MASSTFPFISLSYIPMRFAEQAEGVARRAFTTSAQSIASFTLGIPAIYSIPPKQGGKLVERGDINGIGWIGTNFQKFCQDGGIVTFNQNYASLANVNGYSKGAILANYTESEGLYFVMSLKDNNKDNFITNPSCITNDINSSSGSWFRLTTTLNVVNEIKTIASQAFHFKGTVTTYSALPASGNKIGDVYSVTDEAHTNYVWAGAKKGEKGDGWDSLGKVFDLSDYLAKSEIVTASSASALNDNALPCSTTTTKMYADTKSSAALNSAKSYADGKDETTLASAKSYSDTQDATNLAAGKTYTDQQISALRTELKQYADAAEAAAIDAAEEKAIELDETVLSTAKGYTDTQVGAFETSVKGYTDTQVGALETSSNAKITALTNQYNALVATVEALTKRVADLEEALESGGSGS